MPSAPRARGFTLLELMITVAVIAILASVAYPAYTQYLVRSRRAAAQVVLSDLAQRQQQYLMDNRAYTSQVTDLKLPVPDNVQAFYSVQITVSPSLPPSYTATATPLAGTSQAVDGPLSLASDGTRTPANKW